MVQIKIKYFMICIFTMCMWIRICTSCTINFTQIHRVEKVYRGYIFIRALDKMRKNNFDTTCVISSPNPLFDHLLESSRRTKLAFKNK